MFESSRGYKVIIKPIWRNQSLIYIYIVKNWRGEVVFSGDGGRTIEEANRSVKQATSNL